MNEQTKAQVEAYAEECRTEQLELLRTLEIGRAHV